ncbi:MAG: serine hydrolase [Phycisphaerales bacterium]
MTGLIQTTLAVAVLMMLTVWIAFGWGCGSRESFRLRQLIETELPSGMKIVDRSDEYRLQVLVGEVVRGRDGTARIHRHEYRADAEYFYPASTIKLCAVVAAAHEIERLAATIDPSIGLDTPMVFYPLFKDQKIEDMDDSNVDGGRITVGHEIRKVCLVSDNEAFNRLYDFVGRDALNQSMRDLGLGSAKITHRLSVSRTGEENRRSPRVELLAEGGVVCVPERTSRIVHQPAALRGLTVGTGYLQGGQLVNHPMDFSTRNRMSLRDLQDLLILLVRPDLPIDRPDLTLTPGVRAEIIDAMTRYPADSKNPIYDRATYPDDWAKFLLPGITKVVSPSEVRICNKVGQAYGFTIENAYVEHLPSGAAFFVAAVIYTNEDGVLNDDRYEYQQVALPFMADLGEALARRFFPRPEADR